MSSYVHDLVSKMTKREKGYFRRHAADASGKRNYLKLYDYVVKNKVYDLEDVKSSFKAENIGKYLSSEYNYLAKSILRSLVNFNFKKSEKNKIQESILFIYVLIDKGLRLKAMKLLRQTKKVACEKEYFSQILILIDLEEEILFEQGILGFTNKLKELGLERKSIIDKINNLNQIRLIKAQVRELWYQHGFRTDLSGENSIINDPVLESVEKALSLQAKLHWYYIRAMILYITQQHKESIEFYRKGISLIETNSHLLKEESLLVFFSNCLQNLAIEKDKVAFMATLEELEKLEKSNYILYIKYSRILELYYHLGDFDQGADYSEKVYLFLKENETQLPPVQINYLYQLIIRLNILNRKFSKALEQLNEWKMISAIKLFETNIKLFSLIIYHELEYHMLLRSEIDATVKLLKARKKYHYRIQKLIAFFRNSIQEPESEFLFLEQLEVDLVSKENAPTRLNDWKLFDYSLWIKNRITVVEKGTKHNSK